MSVKKYVLAALCIGVLNVSLTSIASALELKQQPKLQAIADQLIAESLYTQEELEAVFSKAVVQQSVLDAMTNPAEYKFTWGKYRKLFLKDDRIQQGVEFWNEYQQDLDRAEQEYGVPASVIVAIVGVESKYGRYKGSHKVLDSLVTLTVGFPRRSSFFASELKQFLILTKENGLAFDEILGSYAGAVGYPQFISSSYRSYAVDFSADGKTDLINQPVDAIGSIANYFIQNGWQPGEPVTSPAYETVDANIEKLANRKRKTQFTAASLRDKGALLPDSISGDEKLNVLMLDASETVSEPKTSNIYIVRSGDTACQIAETLGISCKALFKLNKINKKGDIFRGQRLQLPAKAQALIAKQESSKMLSVKGSKWEVAKTIDKQVELEQVDTVKERFFFTHRNFYAITQYNHSVLYAMAVHDLSQAIDLAKSNHDQTTNSDSAE
ncbi:MAG: membrane-bound lytic murein transglycosylase B [Arenicella sp.]|jgi:membrane-bound lytic murein transglycosylase B